MGRPAGLLPFPLLQLSFIFSLNYIYSFLSSLWRRERGNGIQSTNKVKSKKKWIGMKWKGISLWLSGWRWLMDGMEPFFSSWLAPSLNACVGCGLLVICFVSNPSAAASPSIHPFICSFTRLQLRENTSLFYLQLFLNSSTLSFLFGLGPERKEEEMSCGLSLLCGASGRAAWNGTIEFI